MLQCKGYVALSTHHFLSSASDVDSFVSGRSSWNYWQIHLCLMKSFTHTGSAHASIEILELLNYPIS